MMALATGLARAADATVIAPAEAAKRVAAGAAVLVDCREPAEWESGVVAFAALLPVSDLRGDRKAWRPFLEANQGKEIIIYCRSGNQAGQAAALLSEEGKAATNAGAFATWEADGQPVRLPDTKSTGGAAKAK